MRNVCFTVPLAPCARPWRARWVSGVVAAALSMPATAHPYGLDALLRLPLERLLQLQVVPRRAALATLPVLAKARGLGAGWGQHEV